MRAVNVVVLLSILLLNLIFSLGNDEISIQKIETLIEVNVDLLQPVSEADVLCDEANRLLRDRIGDLEGNVTSCIPAKTSNSFYLTFYQSCLQFYKYKVPEYLIYTNRRDFRYYLHDVLKSSTVFQPKEIKMRQHGKDGLRLEFEASLFKDGKPLKYTEELKDPRNEETRSLRKRICEEYVKAIKKSSEIYEELGNAFLGCWTQYFIKSRGFAKGITTLHFNYTRLVETEYYTRRVGFANFVDHELKSIMKLPTYTTVGQPSVFESTRGDVTVVKVSGHVQDVEGRANWTNDLRISDSTVFKRLSKEVAQQVHGHIFVGSQALWNAVYVFLLEEFRRDGEHVNATVRVTISQEGIRWYDSSKSKEKIEKWVEDCITRTWGQIIYRTAITDLNVEVTHLQHIPPLQ